MIAKQAFNPLSAFSISETAMRQFAALQANNPVLAGKVVAQIKKHLSAWSPNLEDGQIVRHCAKISIHCRADVYRLKSKPETGQWRVFFYMLDREKPPIRRIEEIIECQTEEQCYDVMTEPHVKRIQSAIQFFKASKKLQGRA